jgi:hypothetical protein
MSGLDFLNWINNKIKSIGGDTFKEDLAISESSGNYDAEYESKKGNKYVGKWQFGNARLTDFKNANKKFKDLTMDQFKNSPSIQNEVWDWHVDDINSYIDSRELDKYIGTELNGVTISREGLIAGAHIGGRTGLKNFLNKGDEGTDELGTTITEYIMKFSE